MKRILLVLLLPLCLDGCLAVAAGAIVAADASSRRANRERFTANFHATNADRMANGLPALDWCSTVYTADQGWARDMDACKARIEAYEAGDTSALDLEEPKT